MNYQTYLKTIGYARRQSQMKSVPIQEVIAAVLVYHRKIHDTRRIGPFGKKMYIEQQKETLRRALSPLNIDYTDFTV